MSAAVAQNDVQDETAKVVFPAPGSEAFDAMRTALKANMSLADANLKKAKSAQAEAEVLFRAQVKELMVAAVEVLMHHGRVEGTDLVRMPVNETNFGRFYHTAVLKLSVERAHELVFGDHPEQSLWPHASDHVSAYVVLPEEAVRMALESSGTSSLWFRDMMGYRPVLMVLSDLPKDWLGAPYAVYLCAPRYRSQGQSSPRKECLVPVQTPEEAVEKAEWMLQELARDKDGMDFSIGVADKDLVEDVARMYGYY